MLIIQKDICKKILHNFYNTDHINGFNDEDIQFNISAINFNQTVGFLGKHLRLQINYKSKTINAFVKIPSDELMDKTKDICIEDDFGATRTEILFYEEILMKLTTSHTFCPKRFYSNLKENIIILEDVSKSGFYMIDKYIGFDLYQSIEIAKTIARFHGTSMRLNEDTLRAFDNEIKRRKNIDSKFVKSYLMSSLEALKALGALIPGINYKLFSKKLNNIFQSDHEKIYNNQKYYKVLNHGDLWSNNVLIKQNHLNDKKYHVMLVDFQLIRYVPPVLDLLKFFLISVNKDVKKDFSFRYFLDVYYDELKQCLSDYSTDLNDFFSREELYETSNEFWLNGLLEASMCATVVYLNEIAYKKIFSGSGNFHRFMMTSERKDVVAEVFTYDENFRNIISDLLIQIANY